MRSKNIIPNKVVNVCGKVVAEKNEGIIMSQFSRQNVVRYGRPK